MKKIFALLLALTMFTACTKAETLVPENDLTNPLMELLTPATKALTPTAIDGTYWLSVSGLYVYRDGQSFKAATEYQVLWFDGDTYRYCYARALEGEKTYYRVSDVYSGSYSYNPHSGHATLTGPVPEGYFGYDADQAAAMHLTRVAKPKKERFHDGTYRVVLDDGVHQYELFSEGLMKLDDIYAFATVTVDVSPYND
jgi:hypothetical protein